MFNRETEYALRALVFIQLRNYQGKRPGVDETSRETGVPRYFAAKILQRLVKQGLLISLKGKGGGFYFDSEQPPVPLKTVIQLTEGNRRLTGCGFGFNACSDDHPCPLHSQYAPIRDALNKLVSEETVQSLAGKVREGKLNLSGEGVKMMG